MTNIIPQHGSQSERSAKRPGVPETIAELGLPRQLLTDLALRYIREHPRLTLTSFRRALKLSFPIAQSILQQLRDEQLVDVKGMEGRDFVFSPTVAGRDRATQTMALCRYAGPVPVPLDQYTATVRAQRLEFRPTLEELQSATAGLVFTDEILNGMGTALCSGKPIFVYGPSGNGKSSLIERLPALFGDTVLVPYAVEVDGKIILVFDPSVHVVVESDSPEQSVDPRWVLCRRPCLVAGGELTLAELSLRLDETSGVYGPPLQMKAANGVLLIDDFGRQLVSPQALFNRWIIPLDRRVDHLSLPYGFTFEIPFETTLVFSTNLAPADLVDEAFIRRVPNKIYLGPVGPQVFDEIFARVIARYTLPIDNQTVASLAAHLRSLCKANGAEHLRACYPADICAILEAMAVYERRPVAVSSEYLESAVRLYFTHRAEDALQADPRRA